MPHNGCLATGASQRVSMDSQLSKQQRVLHNGCHTTGASTGATTSASTGASMWHRNIFFELMIMKYDIINEFTN